MSNDVFDVLVCAARLEAREVLSFELRASDGAGLPPFTAGSHIDLHLPNGLIRNYSLVNSQAETDRYVIAVSLDASSTGGSRYLFDHQIVGQTLKISPPRNNFALVEDAPHVVLIAGGIGITPLHSMILRLEEIGTAWELHYGARDRASAAFREELEALDRARPGRIHFNFDDETGGMLDVRKVVEHAPAEAHLYCCGPLPMLEIFNAAAAGRAPDTVHIEYFTPPEAEPPSADAQESFTVEIAGTDQSFEVGPGESILGVLLENGVNAAFSCTEGMCGTCVVQVLEGEPDHKDFILSERERASNQLMTICVSGSKSKKLVIDLD
ncbi:MAG: PDR/VanB family oxidoreductase [Alphaproteobacteria bacterium]|nr:PDR/VanB family oxidoreductase [Alphaproteobacteria bacterium]